MNSIREMLIIIEKKYPDKVAFQYVDGDNLVKVTFRDYCHDIWKTERHLRKNYDLQDKKIGILSNNNYYSVVMMMAVILSGAIVVPLNVEELPVYFK